MSTLEWWETAIIYQIYPRSFNDSNDDGIGDLNGIIERLDYIAGLGIDAIWISPFFTSPQKDFGYDVAEYCNVNPEYGTLSDFDRLLELAHEKGLKVMIDIVPAHCSINISGFKKAAPHETMTRLTGFTGSIRWQMDQRQQIGFHFSEVAPGRGNHGANNIISIIFCPANPT